MVGRGHERGRLRPPSGAALERELFIDNLLVRIPFIIVMIRWTGLAPWEFEFPLPGHLTYTFLVPSQLTTKTLPSHTRVFAPCFVSQHPQVVYFFIFMSVCLTGPGQKRVQPRTWGVVTCCSLQARNLLLFGCCCLRACNPLRSIFFSHHSMFCFSHFPADYTWG